MKLLLILSVVSSSIALKQVNAQNEELSKCHRVFAEKQRYQYHINKSSAMMDAHLSCKSVNENGSGLSYECQGNPNASGLMPANQYCTAVWSDSENSETEYRCWDFAVGTDFGPFSAQFSDDTNYHCPDTRLLLSYGRRVGSGGGEDYCAGVASSNGGFYLPYYSELAFFEPLAKEYYSEYTWGKYYGDCGSAVLDEGTEMPTSINASTETPTSTPVTHAPTTISSSSRPVARSYCEREFYAAGSSDPHPTYEITNRTIECLSSEMIAAQQASSFLQRGGVGVGGINYECSSNANIFTTIPFNHHCVMITEGTYEAWDGTGYEFQSRHECSDYAVDTNFTSLHRQAATMNTTMCSEEMWIRYEISSPMEETRQYCGEEGRAFSNSGSSYPIYSAWWLEDSYLWIDEDIALQWVSYENVVVTELCLNKTSPQGEPNSTIPSVEDGASVDDAANEDPTASKRSGFTRLRTNEWFSVYFVLATAYQIMLIA